MVLENVCAPALLYLAFSIIQIIIDMYRGDTIQAFFKFIVMIIFTIVLNAICNSGMTIISWFIVFIPFILMTYVTTILFFIFGINPSKIKPSDKKCWETQFGCCDDGITTKQDPSGRTCPNMRVSNVLMVPSPIPANNKDGYYLYPHGRNRRDYSIGGGSVRSNKGFLGDYNKDNDYYNSKKWGRDRDRLRSNTSPKALDDKYSYWKSKLNKSDWDDYKNKYSNNNNNRYEKYNTENLEIHKLISETGKTIIDAVKITKEIFEITKVVIATTGATDSEKATATKIEKAAVAANNEADDALILINSAQTVDLAKAAKVAADKAKTNADKAKVDATSLKTVTDIFKIIKDVFIITNAVKTKTGVTDAQKASATTIETAAVAVNKEASDALILINGADTFDLSKVAKIAADKAKTNADKVNGDATSLKKSANI
jgi:hypothetical protein